jgi:hypothetical protein
VAAPTRQIAYVVKPSAAPYTRLSGLCNLRRCRDQMPGGAMNSLDLELLSKSWWEPELTHAVHAFVKCNGRLPKQHELLETLVGDVTRLDQESSSECAVVQG